MKSRGTLEEFLEEVWTNSWTILLLRNFLRFPWTNEKVAVSKQLQKNSQRNSGAVPRNFVLEELWRIPGDISKNKNPKEFLVELQKTSKKFLMEIPAGNPVANPRINFRRKSPEKFLKEFLVKIPGVNVGRYPGEIFVISGRIPGANLQSNTWCKSPNKFLEAIF